MATIHEPQPTDAPYYLWREQFYAAARALGIDLSPPSLRAAAGDSHDPTIDYEGPPGGFWP